MRCSPAQRHHLDSLWLVPQPANAIPQLRHFSFATRRHSLQTAYEQHPTTVVKESPLSLLRLQAQQLQKFPGAPCRTAFQCPDNRSLSVRADTRVIGDAHIEMVLPSRHQRKLSPRPFYVPHQSRAESWSSRRDWSHKALTRSHAPESPPRGPLAPTGCFFIRTCVFGVTSAKRFHN